jgi:hypothetical protein
MFMPALILHVAAGGVGILSGATALAARKGGWLHRRSGMVFFASMLAMGAMATLLAATIPDLGNLPGGIFTIYLVATAWMTVRRKTPAVGLFDYGALGFALLAGAISVGLAVQAQAAPTGLLDGKGAPLYAIFAGLAAFAAGLDLRRIWLGGLTGRPRIARHVWRMCTALFFGTGSFFLGQQQVMPTWAQGSPWLFVLALAPLVLMIGWLVWIRIAPVFAEANAA